MNICIIDSVDDRLDKSGARSVLVVCQVFERYKEEWNEEKQKHETLLKLRNREDSFIARAAKKGMKITPMRHSDVTEEKMKTVDPVDVVVVAGEVTYQSFSIAARVRKYLPNIPILVEFCEVTYDDTAQKLIVKNARHYLCEDLIESMVYLTCVPKSPRAFVVDQ
jgi:hypothetical protein